MKYIIVNVYRPKGQEVEHQLSEISRVLMLDDEDDAVEFVTHCGFEIIESQVRVSLSLFLSLFLSLLSLSLSRSYIKSL